jgi:hypothetical protein
MLAAQMKRITTAGVAMALVLLGAWVAAVATSAQRASAQMVAAANQFLGALTPEQRTRVGFAIDNMAERTRFNFVPTEAFARNGLVLREMSEPQRRLAHELLKSGLSDRGYFTYTQIMALEDILKVLEQPARFERDKDKYFVSVFGTPADGVAVRGASHFAALHDARRQASRKPHICRYQSGRGARWP